MVFVAIETHYLGMLQSDVFLNNAISNVVGLAQLLEFLHTIHCWSHWDWEFGSVVGNSCI